MSGTASVPTQFAAAVTATGQQLDNNFSTVVAYLNDPTNRNNFAVSSGTGTYAVTISPPPGGYTAGLEITFQAGNTNTAAVALNVNGLGVVSMLTQNSAALTVSQIIANGIYKSVYNGTNFIFQGPVFRPSDFTPTLKGNYSYVLAGATVFDATTLTTAVFMNGSLSVNSVAPSGTGTYVINFQTPLTSTAYACVIALDQVTHVATPIVRRLVRFTDSCVISFTSNTATAAINAGGIVNFMSWGQQA